MAKPLVVVIENPEAGPTVFALGDVDVVETSTYPISKFCRDEEGGEFEGYAEKLRGLASRFEQAGETVAGNHLARCAQEYEARLAKSAGRAEG